MRTTGSSSSSSFLLLVVVIHVVTYYSCSLLGLLLFIKPPHPVAGLAFLAATPRHRLRSCSISSSSSSTGTALHLFAFRGNDKNNNKWNDAGKTTMVTTVDKNNNSNSNNNNTTDDELLLLSSSPSSSTPIVNDTDCDNSDNKEEDDDGGNDDLNGWILNGLRQWPLNPGKQQQHPQQPSSSSSSPPSSSSSETTTTTTTTTTAATLEEEGTTLESSSSSSIPDQYTERNVISTSNTVHGNHNDDDDDDDDDDGNLSGWILNNLRFWPLLSQISAASTSSTAAGGGGATTTTTFTDNATSLSATTPIILDALQQQQQVFPTDSSPNNMTTSDSNNDNNKEDSYKGAAGTTTTSSFPLMRILNMEVLLAFAMQKSKEGSTQEASSSSNSNSNTTKRTNDDAATLQKDDNPLRLLEFLWQEPITTADALLSNISATTTATTTTETEDVANANASTITATSTSTATTSATDAQPTTTATATATAPWWQKPFVSIMGEPQPQPQQQQQEQQQQQQQQLVLISPNQIQTLIKDATSVANMGVTNLGKIAQQMATERGWDVQVSVARAADTTRFARKLVSTANDVLRVGYVRKNKRLYQGAFTSNNMTMPAAVILKETTTTATTTPTTERALFDDFASAMELDAITSELQYDAKMGALAGAIYEETIPKTHALGHTIVARGMTSQVEWMVTDSLVGSDDDVASDDSGGVGNPRMIRTLTIRGFDASDERVDREELLNQVCTATPECLTVGAEEEDDDDDSDDDNNEETMSTSTTTPTTTKVLLHTGLRKIAKAIYRDVAKQYLVDWTCPQHKIALCGHSIGGSLSLLVLLEMVLDQGKDYVLDKVQRVYTFGSPPVAVVVEQGVRNWGEKSTGQCDVLTAFGLPTSLVHAYVQPWDPIVRLFTKIDPFYPLVSDMGADGVTPWVNGPPRTLRPIIRRIAEGWEGWPRFRTTFSECVSQNYTTVGTPHLLLPDPTRYLADRFVSVNIPTPSTDAVVRLAPNELHAALESLFPLDVFEVSYIPQAIRSFVHHFYPSYEETLIDYVKRLNEESQKVGSPSNEKRKQEGKSRQSAAREKRKKSPPLSTAAAFQVD